MCPPQSALSADSAVLWETDESILPADLRELHRETREKREAMLLSSVEVSSLVSRRRAESAPSPGSESFEP